MSELESRYVREGFWHEVARGPVLGRMITTDVRTGTIVIALLAMLVALAFSHLWNLVLFATHQWRANGQPADVLFHQQQALLRATPSPASLLADWTKLYWIARRTTKNAFSRSLLQAMLGFLFAAGAIVAGVFSSFVVDSTNLHVLVQSSNCGPLDMQGFIDSSYALSYASNVFSRSVPFAKDCYRSSNASLPARCNVMVKPNTPLVPERVSCPFNETLCLKYDRPAVTIDSGLVNTNDFFGWNLVPSDEIHYRRKLTCGLLERDGYQRVANATEPRVPGEQVMVGMYSEAGHEADGFPGNSTFTMSLLTSNVSLVVDTTTAVYYNDPENGDFSNTYAPLSGFKTADADIVVIGVAANAVKFRHPVDDPVFSAHRNSSIRRYDDSVLEFYLPDSPLSVIACQEQYQFCLGQPSDSQSCSRLASLPHSVNKSGFPDASAVQLAGIQTLMTASKLFDIELAVQEMLINDMSYAGIVVSLPEDHWVSEITYWEQIVWASLQAMVSDYAIGYGAQEPGIAEAVGKNLTSGERQLCAAQRMVKPGGFMNINVFALSLIATFAVTVTLLDLVLLKFLVFLTFSRKLLAPRIDRWNQDGVFQLQRRAYEADDQGHWTRLDKEVPSTREGDQLSELPLDTRRSCCPHKCGTNSHHVPARMMPRASMTVDSFDTLVAQKGAASTPELPKGDK